MKKIRASKKAKAKIGRIKLQRTLRISVITILGILLILAAYATYAAYQQPTTKEQTKPAVSYIHTGRFDYQVYLKPNILYNNITVMYPGQGTFFKKLIDHINATFTYQFSADKPVIISGTYKLTAQLTTNLWTKEFTIIPEKQFNSTPLTINFPINYTYYEEYLQKINEETGTIATEIKLNIQCMVLLSAHTNEGDINEVFSPSIQIPLEGTSITVEGELTPTQPGSIETTIRVTQKSVLEQRENMAKASIIITAIILVFIAITKTKLEKTTIIERQLKKLNKKYGEWIIETNELPTSKKQGESVIVQSIDDLVKISEETGRPIIHYKDPLLSNLEEQHTFYVFDDETHYKYTLQNTITKTTKCPKCSTTITFKGHLGQKVDVTCPACGNKGFVKIKE